MEKEKPSLTRSDTVFLYIFGAMFAAGLSTVFRSLLWGLFEIIFGLLGMIGLLARNRLGKALRRVPVRKTLQVVAWAAISIFLGHTVSQITATQDDLKTYVMPRVVTEAQASDMQKFLSARPSTVVVNVFANAGDPEALDYASQLTNAIKNGGWDAQIAGLNPWDTTNNGARFGTAFNNMWLALDKGVVIRVGYVGQRGNSDPKKPPPDELLSMAFAAGGIDHTGGSAANQEKYSLIVEVGHRPTIVDQRPSVWFRLGRWLMSFGK